MQQIFKGMDNGASAINQNFNELSTGSFGDVDQTVKSITAKNWSTFNSGAEFFSGLKSHGWANFDYVATSGNVDVSGYINSKKTASTTQWNSGGFNIKATRVANTVQLSIYGTITSSIDSWANVGITMPNGYKPVDTIIFDYKKGGVTSGIQIGTDGVVYNRDVRFNVDGNGNDGLFGHLTYVTADDFPG